MVVQLVMSMLKKGEQSAHEALRSITDEWLCWLAEKATNCGHRAQTKGILVKMDTKGNSLNNKDLLSPVASPWFLPDQIINCWRLTVLCPKFASSSSFCDDLLVEHEDNASFLGDTLTQVKKCVQVSPKHKQLWESLFGWKGFEHIQVLTNYNAQEIMSRASQLHAGGLQGSVNSQSIMDGSFLWTAACFIECLLFYGYTEAAAELAGGCLELLIGVHPKESGIVTDGLSEGLEEVNLLLSIISLHEENVDMLWGGECCENLLVPLMVAYRALEGCVGPWASRMWHLSGVLPAVSFDGDELVISCSLPVVVAVVCCLLPDVVMSVTSQIDVITEKTRIINSVVKCIPNTVRPSLLASLTKMLLSLSRHECNGRFVDMTGMIQLLLSIVEVSQHEYQSDQRSSERLTVSEELASVIRQQTGSEALQSVSSGRDTQPLVYARFTRLISLVLLAVKTSGSLVSVIKSVLDPLLEKGIASLPLGHQHFLSLLVDLVDVIQYNAGLKVAQQGSTLCERLKLLSCCVETLLAQQSVKEGESKKVRSRSSMEGLFLVLRADRMVDGRSCGFRHKALGLLEEIQKDVPGPLILEMMQLFGWKSILHGAEFLFRLLAKKSFQASFQSLKGGTGMKALGEVVSEAAAEVAEGECDDLLRCARKLNLIDLLFQSSLTSGSDLNKSGSAVLLFQLCRESEGDNKQQLQLGFLALRQWKNRLSRPREPPLNGDVFESLMCHNEPDLRCVLGLMWVCALAVYTDMIPTRTLGKAKPVKMVTINRLFTEVSERWIDPLVSYHVLMEVARLWGHFFEVQNLVKNPPKGDHKTGMDLEPPAVLAEHENMLRDPGGLSSVQSLCQRLPSAKQLAEKCKQGFVEGIKMATGSHSGLSAGGSSATTAQCNFIPHRHLILGDLVALDFISKAVPFPDVNVMALVDESDGCSMCADFQEVCSEFKKLVGLMKRFPSGPTEEQKARMKFLQFISMSGQMLAEAGFNVFGSSSDDES